jgi:hypothetical protein
MHVPQPCLSSVSVFLSSSACRAAAFTASLAADRNVDRCLGDTGRSAGCESTLLLWLLLSSRKGTATALATNRNVNHLSPRRC